MLVSFSFLVFGNRQNTCECNPQAEMPGRPCSWPHLHPPPPWWGSEEGVLGGMHFILLPLPAPRRGFNRTKEFGPLGI